MKIEIKGRTRFFLITLGVVVLVGAGVYGYRKYRVSYEQVSALCAPGQFCSGSVSPTSVASGGSYTMGCNYGYTGNGITVVPGSGSCTYKDFSGTTAEFSCTAGTTPGTFANSCELDSASPYQPRTDTAGSITVAAGTSPAPTSTSILIPANAIVASNLNDYPTSVYCPNLTGNNGVTDYQHWICNHDSGTPGSALGMSTIVASPSLDGKARKFYDTYTYGGGEIYHIHFANDLTATHFVYGAEIYLADPANVADVEMDMNQGMPGTGQLVIYGTQCASQSNTWEYAYSKGWHTSNIPCNPTTWSVGWHHVEIASHRDSTGNVTYDWVDFDGKVQYFDNAQSGPPRDYFWSPGTLLINFQLDGKGKSGSITAYADQMTVWRW